MCRGIHELIARPPSQKDCHSQGVCLVQVWRLITARSAKSRVTSPIARLLAPPTHMHICIHMHMYTRVLFIIYTYVYLCTYTSCVHTYTHLTHTSSHLPVPSLACRRPIKTLKFNLSAHSRTHAQTCQSHRLLAGAPTGTRTLSSTNLPVPSLSFWRPTHTRSHAHTHARSHAHTAPAFFTCGVPSTCEVFIPMTSSQNAAHKTSPRSVAWQAWRWCSMRLPSTRAAHGRAAGAGSTSRCAIWHVSRHVACEPPCGV